MKFPLFDEVYLSSFHLASVFKPLQEQIKEAGNKVCTIFGKALKIKILNMSKFYQLKFLVGIKLNFKYLIFHSMTPKSLLGSILMISFLLTSFGCDKKTNQTEAETASTQTTQPNTSQASQPSHSLSSLGEVQHTPFHNFSYVIHTKNEGPKANPGDIVQYHYKAFENGQMIQNSYEFGLDRPAGMFMPDEEKAKSDPQPLGEMLRLMSPGDSATVSTKDSSIPGEFMYHVKMVNIVPKN